MTSGAAVDARGAEGVGEGGTSVAAWSLLLCDGSSVSPSSLSRTTWSGPIFVPSIVTAPDGPVWIRPPGGIWSPACTGRLAPSGNRATAPLAACSSNPGVDPRWRTTAAKVAAAAAPSPPTMTRRRRRRAASSAAPDEAGVTTNSW